MRSFYIPLFILLFIFSSVTLLSQDMKIIDLGGKWKFRKAGTHEWLDAKVPGCVHTDLLRDGLIPDPFLRDNEKNLQWISDIGWEYKKTFIISDTLFRSPRIELVFKGLDTYANVYLNDSLIIVSDNMFREWYANIQHLLKIGTNILRIQFPAVTIENKSRYSRLKHKLPGDEKVVCRKAAYQFGWDWGPTLITSGIWRPIYIRCWDHMNVLNVQYIQNNLTDSVADMTAVFTFLATVSDSALLKLDVGDKILVRKMVPVPPGVSVARVDFRILNPKRWWPNGMGDPYLYPIHHQVYFADQLAGEGIQKLGLRTVEFHEDQDSAGTSFFFLVNDVPVFMKGANYIPQDNFPSRVTDSSYRKLIASVKAANMNMLRVWGGGVYEDKEFYDLCDRLGLMVWQDFMFACGEYPEELWFLREVSTEAQKTVKDLRNHPSIVLWCGNNECEWLYCTQHPDRSPDRMCGAKIFHDVLPTVCREEDGTRPYWRSSPYGKGLPNDESNGNHHQWSVWSLWSDYPEYEKSKARFVTEFGFQAPANERTFESVTLPEDRHPQSKVFEHYNKQVGGVERLFRFLAGHMGVETDFGDFIYKTQLLQAEALKTAVEHWRRRKFKTAGALFWQLNDCWPVSSWSVVDSALFPKAAYYYAKKFFAPVLVSFRKRSNTIEVWGTNDKPARVAGAADIRLRSFDGAEEDVRKFDVILPANTSKKLCSIGLTELTASPPTTSYLLAQFRTDGEVLSSNRFFFVEPKHMHLPSQRINTELSALGENRYLLELRTPTFAKNVRVFVEREDAQFEDNFFDIDAGIPKRIVVTFCGSMDQLRAELTLKAMTGLSTHESIAKDTVL